MDSGFQKELFSSLISDIKHYNGEDPLRPWLQGIRKMRESLPPPVLRDKLPRFLQKCAQTFESDRRYRNDSRYLRVWILLMDYVDDARPILRKMEKNQIGFKRAMFYSAYALYYEKRKRFEDAEKMYHMGVQNLAQPTGELQRSYDQFLHRMKLVKKRKSNLQESVSNRGKSTSNNIPAHQGEASNPSEVSSCGAGLVPHPCPTGKDPGPTQAKRFFEHRGNTDMDLDKPTRFCSDDTVVVKFVGSAIVGKPEAEDACHHGLVDPTINMKEAMNAISSMFREPLEPEIMVRRRLHRSKPKANQQRGVFEVYIDESSGPNSCHRDPENDDQSGSRDPLVFQSYDHLELMNSDPSKMQTELELHKPFVGAFEILADDDEDDKCGDVQSMESRQPARSDEPNMISLGLREDTVVRRFVGSTVLGEPEVENACHHGLVDPTINMKEAMDDINSMFGEPLNYVKLRKPKKQSDSMLDRRPASCGFSILADDDMGEEGGFFEPTAFTKAAMDEINEMFGKPLDF